MLSRFLRVATCVVGLSLLLAAVVVADQPRPARDFDIVVYGGTSGGVAAAVQARRLGKTAVLIEPTQHIGGLSSGGLGATDIGNKAAIGGVSREFYERIKRHYDQADAWKWQERETYRGSRGSDRLGEMAMWTFEPHVAEKVFREMLQEAKVEVVEGERLDLDGGVAKRDGRIVSIRMEDGSVYRGKIFIDATYEGDLMAEAGVSYTVGREANSKYDETLNGVQVRNATKHQFIKPVDPYLVPGDKSSGLLPGIDPSGPGVDGQGDHRVQAYNLRICATDVPENRVPWPKPKDYDAGRYELLLRNLEAGDHRLMWNPVLMPNRKTDSNNNNAVSTDYIGQNYAYPDGDYKTRERIYQDHLSYHQGLFWTLANHERVPPKIRDYFNRWGLANDEFQDNGHWPHQMYVREARRMISGYVMTQHDCQGRRRVDDSVGLAAYTMDSHNVQRYVNEQGHVRNEGDVQVGGFPPYPIAYRSITPNAEECENLLVPVCLSSSHIAFGSIRMEPVFMVLGQSAATAGAMAIDGEKAVQEIAYDALREKLLEDGQVLEWTGRGGHKYIDPRKLPGVVIDDNDATTQGEWLGSVSIPGFIGPRYLHDKNEGQGKKSVRFPVVVSKTGMYEVRLAYTANPNRATNAAVEIRHADGESEVLVNQRKTPPLDERFISLGKFPFQKGEPAAVIVSNRDANGHVIADAVQVIPMSK